MKNPLELLQDRYDQILLEYNRVLHMYYPNQHDKPWVIEFEAKKKEDLKGLKAQLDQYKVTINILKAFSNESE